MEYAKLCKVYSELEENPKRLAKTYIISGFLKECSKDDLSVISLLIQGRLFPHWDESKIGVASRLVLKAISLATGISHDKVEKEWKKTGDLGLVAFNLISVKKQRTLFSSKLTVKKVFDNLRKLPSMEGLGAVEKKISLISELLTSAKPTEAKYIVRTVLEEMRIGVGEGSLRDAIVWAFFAKEIGLKYNSKENDIEVKDREEYNKYVNAVQHAYDLTNDFSAVVGKAKTHGLKGLLKEEISIFTPIKVMLALKVKDVKEAFERVGKPAEIEFKYDGFRCITGHTPIYALNKGLISVKDVRVNDMVLTHKGNFKRVLALNKRKIDKKERLFTIQTFLGNKFNITEKHKILVKEGNKIKWIKSEKLNKKCSLIFPIPKIRINSQIKDKLVLRDDACYKKTITINNNFFRFLGCWIGDGFTNNYHNTERIGLIFNKEKEKKLCDLYEKIIKNTLKIKNVSRNIHQGAIYLYWRDKPFRIWLSGNFRKEWKGKFIPNWFLGISKDQFLSFMKGWIESDGYKDKIGRVSITTKERQIAMIIQLIALKFSIVYGVKKIRINNKTYYRMIITKVNKHYKINKDYIEVKLFNFKEIKRPDPRINLYNLQVKDDESYCTTLISLHNCQIHKKSDKIKIFTRRLEDVTKQFSELIPLIKKNIKGDFIIDSECVGYNPKTKKYLPFQNISQRIRRKYDIEAMAKKFPVELNLFDIIYYNGKNLIKSEFKERRKLLEKIVKPVSKKLILAKKKVTSSEKDAEKFYKEALKLGNEGVIFKNMRAPYKPGARVGHMIKLKGEKESLDLVIVRADWGEGKRAHWLSSFTLACMDKGKYLEIGKVGTGIKEKSEEGVSFGQLTKELKPLIIKEKGKNVEVRPKVVVEVEYEEIQKSPTYSSGFALRFPRIKTLRAERSPKDITTLDMIKDFYKEQGK